MSHIEKRGPARWRARYRGPDGKERSRTFERRADAQRFLADQQVKLTRGEWSDPARARVTVAVWGEQWLQSKAPTLKASTTESYRSLWETCVKPD